MLRELQQSHPGAATSSASFSSKREVTETFSVVIPLQSMSADFVVNYEK